MKGSIRTACAFAALASPAWAVEPLSAYTHIETYPIAVSEASGIAYNWDTDTLFAIGDEGQALVQFTKTGQTIDMMHFDFNVSPREARGLDDPEGVAYLGNNTFIIADERDFFGRVTTYQAGATRTQADLNPMSYDFDYMNMFGDSNAGLEGVAYDPVEQAVWGVKELGPVGVYRALGISQTPGNSGIPFSVSEPIVARTITRWNTYPLEAPLEFNQTSDIYALSACPAFPAGHPRRMNLLILSRDRKLIIEITRTGTIVDTLDTLAIGRGTIEGMVMDKHGTLYLCSEQSAAPNNFPGLHKLSPPPPPGPFSVTACVMGESEESVTATVTWNSTIGKQYVIEFSETLADDDWQTVSPPTTASTASSTMGTQPLPKDRRGFFRVKEVTPP
ncbi:SdiA-regulated domain-containing protein [Luteolibacter sp. Populi]|uniref:SdiA-regulated domain-containing protein n=1 Tax=Luteolibacter sp. Populi TaxID=3230487 RepID=UPI003465ECE2